MINLIRTELYIAFWVLLIISYQSDEMYWQITHVVLAGICLIGHFFTKNNIEE